MRLARPGASPLRLLACTVLGAASIIAAPAAANATTVQAVRIVNKSSTCLSTFCYKPPRVSVAPGTQVVWTNRSTASHTVTRCSPSACLGHSGGTGSDSGLASSIISPSGSYSFTFKGAGTYVYYCAIHGYTVMHGTVTVT